MAAGHDDVRCGAPQEGNEWLFPRVDGPVDIATGEPVDALLVIGDDTVVDGLVWRALLWRGVCWGQCWWP